MTTVSITWIHISLMCWFVRWSLFRSLWCDMVLVLHCFFSVFAALW